MKANIIIRLSAILAVAALASCNTVKGVGQDVQKAGSGISKGAQKVEDKTH